MFLERDSAAGRPNRRKAGNKPSAKVTATFSANAEDPGTSFHLETASSAAVDRALLPPNVFTDVTLVSGSTAAQSFATPAIFSRLASSG
jgi:hypothetical protein